MAVTCFAELCLNLPIWSGLVYVNQGLGARIRFYPQPPPGLSLHGTMIGLEFWVVRAIELLEFSVGHISMQMENI